ncbi:MAG: hypothetical protein ACK5TG_20945 [Planctomyces sp.]
MQIDDPAAASVFDRLLLAVQSGFKTLFPRPRDHDWSADEAEWATDVMLTSIHSLSAVYPDLVKHAVTQFGAVVFFAFRHPSPLMAAREGRGVSRLRNRRL